MYRRSFFKSAFGVALAASMPAVRGQPALFPSLESPDPGASSRLSAVDAVTGTGKQLTLKPGALQDFRDSLRGPLLLPGNAAYDKARRVRNLAINKHPALIVQPTGTTDIRRAVDFARENDLLLAIKGGGHSPAGRSTCDKGMMIDLSGYRFCRVYPEKRIAHVSGGSLWGEVDHEALAFGLVTPAGSVSHTGVGGLTLGGGYGRISRKFGLTIDNLKAVDIVTADGRLLHASAEENQDLYWGVRGGGGNFGVVTAFEFQLHPFQRNVIAGELIFPHREMRNLMRFYAEYSAGAPDELETGIANSIPTDPSEGTTTINFTYCGPPEKAEKLLAPIRKAGTVLRDTVRTVDFEVLQRSYDGEFDDLGQYQKSGFIKGLDEKLIDVIMAGLEPAPNRMIYIGCPPAGGAISRVPVTATAFANRLAPLNLVLYVNTPPALNQAPNVAYARKYWATLDPYTAGFYTNIIAEGETQTNTHANYGENFPRLLALKRKHDPRNLFRLNANINPDAKA